MAKAGQPNNDLDQPQNLEQQIVRAALGHKAKVDTTTFDDNTIFFECDQATAKELGENLGEIFNIKGQLGNNKYPGPHADLKGKHGIILTPQNMEELTSLIEYADTLHAIKTLAPDTKFTEITTKKNSIELKFNDNKSACEFAQSFGFREPEGTRDFLKLGFSATQAILDRLIQKNAAAAMVEGMQAAQAGSAPQAPLPQKPKVAGMSLG